MLAASHGFTHFIFRENFSFELFAAIPASVSLSDRHEFFSYHASAKAISTERRESHYPEFAKTGEGISSSLRASFG